MKPRELKMEYSSKNIVIRWLNAKCCNWGQRMPSYDIQNNIVGNSAPLWLNPSKTFYIIFSIINLILSILFISSYAAMHYSVYNGSISFTDTNITVINNSSSSIANGTNLILDQECIANFYDRFGTFFIIFGSLILLINTFSNLHLYLIEYASDEEWYRYLFCQFLLSIILLSLDITEYYFVSANFTYYNQHQKIINSFQSCSKVFTYNLYVNLVIAIIISFLSIFQIFKTFKNYKLLFYNEKPDYFRARCDDPNILIMTKN